MSRNVVVVESPAKAKTINKYLGNDFTVLASYGHVRDLPAKDGSVRPEENFAMTYEVDADAKKQVAAIASAVKNSDKLFLATDPDREGEAISWHVLEALKDSKAIKPQTDVKRIVFHEITKKAVTHAIEHPRDIDMNLVNAQQARRALDYLVGFTLSPVLWRKLPGSRSAGRVQSVALRLITEREQEIELFTAREYWDVMVTLQENGSTAFDARLVEYQGEKVEKFTVTHKDQAEGIESTLKRLAFSVKEVTPKQQKRNPYAPFMTSTLQMDAARKLGFSAKKTMQLAQKLYEGLAINGENVGLITYMRTDGITVSTEAVAATREWISGKYGASYLPDAPRMYKTKAKNAQEAHEAIRPTDITRTPDSIRNQLDGDMFRLYELIWKRMAASQMEAAVYDQVVAEFTDKGNTAKLRATGSVLKFDGFLTLYQEAQDDDADSEDETSRRLPPLQVGLPLDTKAVKPEQHFTEPPPRYSEASLVKKMEELGIGRPSTYASIISVLVDRNYVLLDKKRFIPQPLGRLVSAFLGNYFERYVEYDFTAQMEDILDDIANGEKDWKEQLGLFWNEFIAKVEESKQLTITEILDRLDKVLEPFTFGTGEEVAKARVCPKCGEGRLSLKTGKFGAFLGCSNYPECNYTRELITVGGKDGEGNAAGAEGEFPRILGNHPDTKEVIAVRKGPYGVYLQLGEEKKPKRTSLPPHLQPMTVTLEQAIALLSLPRELGNHPETGKLITASIGRYGPYLLHDGQYTNLPAGEDVLTIGMNRAVDLIAEKAAKGGGRKGVEPVRSLGEHPDTKETIGVYEGRYGAYVKMGKINATLAKDQTIESVTLEQAIALLAERAGAAKKGGKKASAKKAAEKKPAAKKPAAKKPAAKKPAAKKKA